MNLTVLECVLRRAQAGSLCAHVCALWYSCILPFLHLVYTCILSIHFLVQFCSPFTTTRFNLESRVYYQLEFDHASCVLRGAQAGSLCAHVSMGVCILVLVYFAISICLYSTCIQVLAFSIIGLVAKTKITRAHNQNIKSTISAVLESRYHSNRYLFNVIRKLLVIEIMEKTIYKGFN